MPAACPVVAPAVERHDVFSDHRVVRAEIERRKWQDGLGPTLWFSDRQRTLEVMTGSGTRFVCEFERPLIQPVPDPHRIRSRLRARPERRRLDILLAPSGKGRYPNLSDHKDNVMYDVVRVVRLLRDQSFACGPPYAEGDWVVVPVQFKGCSKQAGGK